MSARDWAGRLHLPTLAALALVLAGWTLLARRYGAFVLPAPWSIVTGLVEIVRSGEIWGHAGASLGRIAAGFGSAVAVSLLMGLGAFVSRTARGIVQDLLAVLRATSTGSAGPRSSPRSSSPRPCPTWWRA